MADAYLWNCLTWRHLQLSRMRAFARVFHACGKCAESVLENGTRAPHVNLVSMHTRARGSLGLA